MRPTATTGGCSSAKKTVPQCISLDAPLPSTPAEDRFFRENCGKERRHAASLGRRRARSAQTVRMLFKVPGKLIVGSARAWASTNRVPPRVSLVVLKRKNYGEGPGFLEHVPTFRPGTPRFGPHCPRTHLALSVSMKVHSRNTKGAPEDASSDTPSRLFRLKTGPR